MENRHPKALPGETAQETASRIGFYRYSKTDPEAIRIQEETEKAQKTRRKKEQVERLKKLRESRKCK